MSRSSYTLSKVPTKAFSGGLQGSDFYRLAIPKKTDSASDSLPTELVIPAFWPNGWHFNYFHWTLDVLPSILAAAKIQEIHDSRVYILVPKSTKVPLPTFVTDWLMRLEENRPNVVMVDDWSEKDLPESVYQIADGRIRRPAVTLGGLKWTAHIDTALVDLIRHFMPASESRVDVPAKIFISRRNAPARRTSCSLRLEDEFGKLGYVPHTLEDLSIKDQASLFSGANRIAGSHGAGFTNLIWSNKAVVHEFVTMRHVVIPRRAEFLQISRTRGNRHRWFPERPLLLPADGFD